MKSMSCSILSLLPSFTSDEKFHSVFSVTPSLPPHLYFSSSSSSSPSPLSSPRSYISRPEHIQKLQRQQDHKRSKKKHLPSHIPHLQAPPTSFILPDYSPYTRLDPFSSPPTLASISLNFLKPSVSVSVSLYFLVAWSFHSQYGEFFSLIQRLGALKLI